MLSPVTQFAWYALELPLYFYMLLFQVASLHAFTGQHRVSLDELARIQQTLHLKCPEEYLAMKFLFLDIYRNMRVPRWLILSMALQTPLYAIVTNSGHLRISLLGEAAILVLLFSPSVRQMVIAVMHMDLLRHFRRRTTCGGHPFNPHKKYTGNNPFWNMWHFKKHIHTSRRDNNPNAIQQEPQYKPDPPVIVNITKNSAQVQNEDIPDKYRGKDGEYVQIKVSQWLMHFFVGTRRPTKVQYQPICGSQQKREGH
ncbi:MAG: hypothetical protein ACYCS8_05035 [Acidithiobacillus sp.]